MKGWENNAMLYNQQKKAGNCPKCGSKDIKVEEYVRGIRKSISFLCKNCVVQIILTGLLTNSL